AVCPGLQGVKVTSLGFSLELSPPAVVLPEFHGNFLPVGSRRRAMAQDLRQDVMAIDENVGAHFDAFPDGALNRKTAAVDLGAHVFDDDLPGISGFDGVVFP